MIGAVQTRASAPVSVVSGGSRGIGRAVCLALAAEGHSVAYCYKTESEQAFQTRRDCEALGVQVMALRCDVAIPADCNAFIAAVIKRFQGLDVLVNCAGITRDGSLVSMTDEAWTQVMDTNLTGVFNLSRAAVFHLIKQGGGAIVNMSSVSGVYGNARQTNYSASKAGIIGLTKALAKEVAGYGVRVNAVAPGFIETDMTAVLSDKTSASMRERIPLKRFGQAQEVGSLVRFLVSPQATYITGQVLQIDGGIAL